MHIAVIGGGAGGMIAAIAAAQNGATVKIYERSERLGRKLLSTGNGQCNLSNRHVSPKNYHGEDPDFSAPALAACGEKLEDFFAQLGIFLYAEEDGRIFPYSKQASAVLDRLRFGLARYHIEECTEWEIVQIRPQKKGFLLTDKAHRSQYADKVIVACGGAAAAPVGGSSLGYSLLQKLGHRLVAVRPALVQLKTDFSGNKALSGIKIQANVSLSIHDTILRQEIGEILFTDYGLSGKPILQCSGYITEKTTDAKIILDLLPQCSIQWLQAALFSLRQNNGDLPLEHFLSGLLPKRLGQQLLKALGIAPLSRHIDTLQDEEILHIAKYIKQWPLSVCGTQSLAQAQVTAGGIACCEFYPYTMESLLHKGLFACGEVLDLYGDCGGFNLHWAFCSGYLAGSSAATIV